MLLFYLKNATPSEVPFEDPVQSKCNEIKRANKHRALELLRDGNLSYNFVYCSTSRLSLVKVGH